MRQVLPLSALILAAALFITGAFVARDNRAQPVASNPDVICAEVCVQLVPWRVGMGRYEAPVERGS